MKKRVVVILFCLLLVLLLGSFIVFEVLPRLAAVPPIPTVPLPPPATSTPSLDQIVVGYAFKNGGAGITAPAGVPLAIGVSFQLYQAVLAGAELVNRLPLEKTPPDLEMRSCASFVSACAPSGAWQPFVTPLVIQQDMKWIGSRTLYLGFEFRQAPGKPLPVFLDSDFESTTRSQARLTLNLESSVDLTASPDTWSSFAQTAVMATRITYPVTGSVALEGNQTVVGGKAGSTIHINVIFQAQSPAGRVTEMRIERVCMPDQVITSPWEPFVNSRTYEMNLPLNWTGFYLAVQYRDEKGGISPVYCLNVSVEGNP